MRKFALAGAIAGSLVFYLTTTIAMADWWSGMPVH